MEDKDYCPRCRGTKPWGDVISTVGGLIYCDNEWHDRHYKPNENPGWYYKKNKNPARIGIGGAPTRNTSLPTDAAERKQYPIASGLMDYFPDALAAVAHISWLGNEQHNPGRPMHWNRSKSSDEADTMLRHFLQRGSLDTDGVSHSAKMAWRALALLQKEIEEESKKPESFSGQNSSM